MTLVDRPVAQTLAPAPSSFPLDLGLIRLLFGIVAQSAVNEVRVADGDGRMRVWVILATDDHNAAEAIYLLERNYLRAAGVGSIIDLQVVSMSEVDLGNLPPSESVYHRT